MLTAADLPADRMNYCIAICLSYGLALEGYGSCENFDEVEGMLLSQLGLCQKEIEFIRCRSVTITGP